MKKILLAVTILGAFAFQCGAQCTDQQYHPHGFPPGPEGTYNNPFIVHADLGTQAIMGDYRLGGFAPWYYVTGFWDQPQTESSGHPYPYINLFGNWYHGQFLTFTTQSYDYSGGRIYMVADPGRGWLIQYYRIVGGRSGPGTTNVPPCTEGTN